MTGPGRVPQCTAERASVFDACVVGGGPAGAVAAALLAQWGWSVAFIHREQRQPGIAESLPGSMQKVLQFLGVKDVVDAGHFTPNLGNVSVWGDEPSVTTTDAAGYHVDRARFDALLRQRACRAGVTDVRATVRAVSLGDPSRIECEGRDGESRVFLARFVLDCSGRAGVVGRRLFTRATAGYRTVAFISEWTSDNWPAAETGHTLVESYADGWAWSVPLDATRRQCTVMWDPERARGGTLEREYLEQLGHARNLTGRLARARQISRTWTCDATVYRTSRMTDAGLLVVGDAASFVETLSSAGVRKAMISAWRAAIVVNTLLRDQGMSAFAYEYFEERERHMLATCVDRAAEFFDTAARAHGSDFWRLRATSRSMFESARPETPTSIHSSAMRRAFERLVNASPHVRFAAGDLQFRTAPEIEGQVLVLREGLVLHGAAPPTLFVGGVELAPLARLAIQSQGIERLLAGYETHVGAVAPDQLLAALSLLVASGTLVQADVTENRNRAEALSSTGP